MKKIFVCVLISIIITSCNTSANDDIFDLITGDWEISHAIIKETNEEYSLQNIYGTGIEYGGILSLNQDGTFNKYIGITDGSVDSHEGEYHVLGNSISLEYRNGEIESAVYIPDVDEIQLENERYSGENTIYEYFVRKN